MALTLKALTLKALTLKALTLKTGYLEAIRAHARTAVRASG